MSRRVRPGAGRFASAASGSAARRSVRGALTLGLVAMAVLVTSCATPGAPATEGELSEDELLVMSFNIRMIYDNEGERTRWIGRRADVVEFIRRARATIVTLQEVETRAREPMPRSEQLSYLQGELPEYAFACIPEPGVLSRQPILYDATRLRLLDEGMVLDAPIERYREGFRGRIASWALFAIDAPQGERLVRVINVHYHHLYASSQLESSWRLRDFLRREVADDEAVVVVGDFNLPEGSRILDPLREAGLSHALPPTSGSYHFFSGVTLWPRIDHVLVNDRLEPLGGGLIRDRAEAGFPSDHFPVFSRLRLRSRE